MYRGNLVGAIWGDSREEVRRSGTWSPSGEPGAAPARKGKCALAVRREAARGRQAELAQTRVVGTGPV